MRRYVAYKKDLNQNGISNLLTNIGCDVFDLSPVGGGVTDLLVGTCGVNLLIEIKSEKGTLTPKQKIFHGRWRGRVDVARSADDALEIVREIRKGLNFKNEHCQCCSCRVKRAVNIQRA